MMTRSLIIRHLVAISLLGLGPGSAAQTISIAQEHSDNHPFQLTIEVLELALDEYSEGADIDWVDATELVQARALRVLENCDADFDVYFSGYDPERERRLLQVNVPVTLGLLGARGFVTTREHKETLLEKPVEEWTIGSGLGWPDTTIMINAGFDVHQAPYENLWLMVSARRVDVIQRGLHEAQLEIAQRGGDLLLLDQAVMVYPLAIFLYVSPCRPDLHALLEQVLEDAHRSGQTQALLRADLQVARALEMLTAPDVQHFVLENPSASDEFIRLADRYFLEEIRALLW